MDQHEIAIQMVQALYDSEVLTQAMMDVITEHQTKPVTTAFALVILEQWLGAQVPEWEKLRHVVTEAIEKMQKEGIIPTIHLEDGQIVMKGGDNGR